MEGFPCIFSKFKYFFDFLLFWVFIDDKKEEKIGIKKFSVGKICNLLDIINTAKTDPRSKILDMVRYLC